MLKVLYRLHNDPDTEEALKYAMGFMGYMETIEGVAENIERGHVGYCKFYKGKKSDKNDKKKKKKNDYTHFQQQYYPPLLEDIEQGGEPIRNDTSLEKNIILSAPNKAGKTTLLKTTLMNVVFSQQFGVGFYETARLEPYAHLHSYLNIPDTSGRDSLFQAESRRCKEIIDCIRDTALENPEQKHFCIFDELYSGTNPEEATQAGKAFLSYLGKCRGVDFLLTTHYIDICKHFYKEEKEEEDDDKTDKKKNRTKEIDNYLMEVLVSPETGAFHYTYKMKRGISTIKGGIRVLQDMDYPQSILEEIRGNAFKIKYNDII
jgi:DNA mismatch repair ATPase MutS